MATESSSSSLVLVALTVRKTVRGSLGLVAGLAFGLTVVLGVFHGPLESMGPEHAAVAAAWLAVLVARSVRRFRTRTRLETRWLELELGWLLLVGAHGLVQLGGGLEGRLYPIIYVVVAFLASFIQKPMGSVLVLLALAFEGLLFFVTESDPDPSRFALHGVFILLFGALNVVFTRAEIARVRERSKKELDHDREKVKEESRLFRLVGAASADSGQPSDEKVFRSSLQEVHHSLYHLLELLKRTMKLETCVLLMKAGAHDELLSIVELATDRDDVADGPFKMGEGAVGATASRGLTMNLENLKPGYKGICYYPDGADVRSFLAVPVEENGTLQGALCVDRATPFGHEEEAILQRAVQQVLRAIENERVFVQLERSKREQSSLFRASRALGGALTEAEVIEAALEAAKDIASYEFAAITSYDAEHKRHAIVRAEGEGAERFDKLTFRDNTSLTAMAVKNRHYLPYRGEFEPNQQVVYTRRKKLPGMRSLLILPLIVREDAIGTLALAAERPDAFNDAVRPTLQVLANQLAVALSNAAAVKRLEEMATTDGLTGCLNKRAFLDELDKRIVSAGRFGRKLSLLVTDIDHFKNVNDTYGHDVGDVVIKELGAILTRVKRDTDAVARFGGEEFCVLCEETDTEGAIILAERIREELQETIFHTDLGKVSVQCSVGVATFPKDASDPKSLFKVTDQALYAAKRSGRNKVCTSGDA